MAGDDEFYIGYEPALPPGVGRRVRAVVTVMIAMAVGAAVLVTRTARPLASSSFEYGHLQRWGGYLVTAPAPALLVPSHGGYAWYWLVGRGKHGADAALNGMSGGWVQVDGTLISRDAWRMIEVSSAGRVPAPTPAPAPAPPESDPRELTVRGEVVDSKCFLGVMNPGERAVHRDCAIRCLSGGVPPMIAYRDDRGRPALAVLVDAHGRLLHETAAPFAGRPVVAAGRVYRVNGQPVFQLASLTGVSR